MIDKMARWSVPVGKHYQHHEDERARMTPEQLAEQEARVQAHAERVRAWVESRNQKKTPS